MLVHMSVIYVDNIRHSGLSICFYSCFGVLFDFLLFEKSDQETVLIFVKKIGIKCSRTFEMLTVTFNVTTMIMA